MGTLNPKPADDRETLDKQETLEAIDVGETSSDTSRPPPKAPPPVEPKQQPQRGEKISQLGDFKLVKKLGSGGMGEVFLAHQISLDRPVALKVMKKQFSSQPNFAERFKREAKTMAKLDHTHTVRGYAVGEDQGLLYLAMELVEGKSMQDWMNKLQKLDISDALHVVLLVADALRYANKEANLIHRDIKPDNILITKKGVVKLSDMGLAKATDDDLSMTQSGTGLGTPYYMPPEQFGNAKHVDLRSDIYALGCTLYYFVTGKLPFQGTSALEMLQSKTKGTYPRARSLNSSIPERMDLIIDKMLAKDPKVRYQNYDDMIRDLTSLNQTAASLSFVEGADPEASRLPGGTTNPSVKLPPAPTPSKRRVDTSPNPAAPQTGNIYADEAIWHVARKMPGGNIQQSKMTTRQLKQLIQVNQLDPKLSKICPEGSKALKSPTEFRDFMLMIEEVASRNKEDAHRQKLNSLVKRIDSANRWHKWRRYFGGLFDSVQGLISLVIYLAILGAVVVGLIFYGPTLYAMIKTQFFPGS